MAAAACQAPAGLQGPNVRVMLADMGPVMMGGQPRTGVGRPLEDAGAVDDDARQPADGEGGR